VILDNFKSQNQLGFSNVYLFIQKENINKNIQIIRKFLKRNQLDRSLFCFIEIPNGVIDEEKFFLDFAIEILSRRKLADSNLIVFSDKDYTKKYESQRLENKIPQDRSSRDIDNSNPYHFIFLNPISKVLIKSSLHSIKEEILKN
jgi:hypothetical protein